MGACPGLCGLDETETLRLAPDHLARPPGQEPSDGVPQQAAQVRSPPVSTGLNVALRTCSPWNGPPFNMFRLCSQWSSPLLA